jgi:myo-inositol-1(or 4)-monophosphatase
VGASIYDPEDLRRVAVRIASEAAALLRDYACDREYTRGVGGETIVADRVAEDYIIDSLRGEGLRVRGVSEERGYFGDGDLVVVIDPLDGSSNYSNCISWASVSIAFALGNRLSDVIAGSVAPVFFGHPISFSRGHGCYEGEVRVEPSRNTRMVFAYAEDPTIASKLLEFIKDMGGNVKIRGLGSAALEIAYVALGRAALFVDARSRLRNVDVAASVGIIRECGGEAYNAQGEPLEARLDEVVVVGDVIASLDRNLALTLISKTFKAKKP